jgi:hypothetical protein
MIHDTLARFLKRLTTPSPTNTILPGRWRNVGKGRTDTLNPDPAYSKPKQGTVSGASYDTREHKCRNW